METIILASSSPRRKELLAQIDVPFLVKPIPVDERVYQSEKVVDAVERLAREKIEALVKQFGKKAFPWVVGADTLIELDGVPIGKPSDGDEARRMLRCLSGKTHRVVSGIALYNGRNERMSVAHEMTDVTFAELSDDEVSWYAETMEWQGAAGGYRIQGRGACLIERIAGSYSSVMGLPIRTFYGMLKDNHYPFV